MDATPIFQQRLEWRDGAIGRMTIWRLPAVSAERSRGLKYSLFYGRPRERIIGYDNERGKGDHRQYRDREERYAFVSVEQLVVDFLSDVRRQRNEPAG